MSDTLRDAPVWRFHWFVILAGAYCLCHGILRLLLSDVVGVDDTVEAILVQSLDWTYNPKQPPLYTWILWASKELFGLSLINFLAIKYLALFAVLVLFRIIGEAMTGSAFWGSLAAWFLLLLYQIGWNVHEGFTHTLTMVVAMMATLTLFMRQSDRATLLGYLGLGLAIGLGFLSKFGFASFLICLFGAALLQPAGRRLVLDKRMVLTVAVAATLVVPVWLQMREAGQDIGAVTRATMAPHIGLSWLEAAWKGLSTGLGAVAGFLSPLLPFAILTAPRAFRPSLPGAAPMAETDVDWRRFVGHMLLIGVFLVLAGALFAGVTNYRERWMHPLMLVAPLWIAMRLRDAEIGPRRVKVLIGMILFASTLAIGWRVAERLVGPPLCDPCRLQVPYSEIADRVRAETGFSAGTIFGSDEMIAGNMAVRFPDAFVFNDQNRSYWPPVWDGAPRDCLAVWSVAWYDEALPVRFWSFTGTDTPRWPDRMGIITVSPTILLPARPIPELRFGYAFFEGGIGDCR